MSKGFISFYTKSTKKKGDQVVHYTDHSDLRGWYYFPKHTLLSRITQLLRAKHFMSDTKFMSTYSFIIDFMKNSAWSKE